MSKELYDLYLKNSLIPKRYQKEIELVPSNTDKPVFYELRNIRENVKEFVNGGNNLLICSDSPGNGKTTWATKILRAYIESVSDRAWPNNTPALFLNINSFLNEKRMAIDDPEVSAKVQKIEKALKTAKLVVFDDIVDKRLTSFENNNLFYWIDYRTSNMLSCIYTTNQLPKDLEIDLEGKLYSRIVKYSYIKEIKDGDHRKAEF